MDNDETNQRLNAAKCGISTGAATRIIQDWKQRIGFDLADQLRDLARGLKKLGLSVVECAKGFRTHQVLDNLGVEEDDLESFLVRVYDKSRHIGLESQQIAEYLSDLVSFSAEARRVAMEEREEEGARSNIPLLSQFSLYIAGMKEEKSNLEKEISRLRNEKEAIFHEKSTLGLQMDSLIAEHRLTKEAISWYSQAKSELAEDGFSIGEISELRQAIKFVHDAGYDLSKITRSYSEFGAMRVENRALQYQISELREQARSMEQSNSLLRSRMDSNSQTLSVIDELKGIGFGYKNLKRLHNPILEACATNGLPHVDDSATEKFLDDIERDYVTVLGFKETIQKLRKEITQLNLELKKIVGTWRLVNHQHILQVHLWGHHPHCRRLTYHIHLNQSPKGMIFLKLLGQDEDNGLLIRSPQRAIRMRFIVSS